VEIDRAQLPPVGQKMFDEGVKENDKTTAYKATVNGQNVFGVDHFDDINPDSVGVVTFWDAQGNELIAGSYLTNDLIVGWSR
jgi:hypothetical protein